MSLQYELFPDERYDDKSDIEENEGQGRYTTKVEAPIYDPSPRCPHILELVNARKTQSLIKEIQSSSVSDLEKEFLVMAAWRHAVFNYSKIADYYSHASKVYEMGAKYRRIHHVINWNNAVPCIIREEHKKN